nr:zinc-dependent alcohol dehydrogenase family protein [Dissulfuribacter thermophilus]
MKEVGAIRRINMLAMVLDSPNRELVQKELPTPVPGKGEILIKVEACAVCRTDIHIVDGDLTAPSYPVIPGHEIVGIVTKCGDGVTKFREGDRVGVPWLGKTCGVCEYCNRGLENLCDSPEFTGFSRPGGFAEYTVAHESFAFHMPKGYCPEHAAPLLCAGLIGYRSYSMVRGKKNLGLYGFGAAAHIIAQVAVFEGHDVYCFTRPGDLEKQSFAKDLGCKWSGGSDELPPVPLDAAIIFAPSGPLVPQALKAVKKGGIVVCAGIHMSDIPSFPYSILWGERVIMSVANLTRKDASEFLAIAPKVPVRTQIKVYDLKDANLAISEIKEGKIRGAAVLKPNC